MKPYILALLLLMTISAQAQLSGTYQVGAALPNDPTGTRTFNSLANALSSTSGLNSGVSGPVTFVLVDAAYPLTAALTVAAPVGVSGTNTVTVQPAAGVTPLISGNVAGALLTLNGTDYLTFNGNNGSGGQAITIRNSGNGAAVLLQNNATNNVLRYLILESAVTGGSGNTPTAGTVQLSATAGTTGNSNNLLEYCDVRAVNNSSTSVPTGAIYATGTSTVTNADVTVQHCNIYNFSAGGVYLDNTGGNRWIIRNNHFYQTGTRSSQVRVIRVATGNGFVVQNNSVYQTAGTQGTPFYGVTVANGANVTIASNTIGGATATAGGNALSFTGTGAVYGIYLSASTTTASSVQGNVVRNLSSASTGTLYGINLQNGAANIGTTAGNAIGGTGSEQGISHAGTAYGVLIENASVGNVQNNTVAGIATTVTSAIGSFQVGTLAGICASGSGANTISNNTIASLSGNTINQSSTAAVSAATSTPVAGVYVSGNGANTIDGNVIGPLTSASTFVNNGTTTLATAALIPLAGVYLLGGGASPVSNNLITGLSATGGAPLAGVYVLGNGALAIRGNTINTLSGNTTTAAALWGIASTGSGAVPITNNIIGGLGQSGSSSNLYGIQANFTAGSTVSGNVLTNISYSGTSTGQTVYGIYAGGDNTVSDNSVQNVTAVGNNNLRGIFVGGAAGNTPTVTGNTMAGVQSSATGGANIAGLYVGSATAGAVLGTTTISSNLVSNVGSTATGTGSPSLTIAGLQLGASNSGAAATSVVERNRVWNVYGSTANNGGGADQVRGLLVQGSFSGTFANNQVSLSAGSARQVSHGILDASSSSNTNYYYYNSVYVAPASSAATNISYAFLRSASSPVAVALRNNLLYNGRTPASGTPAIGIGTAATVSFSSNYNLLIAPNASVMGNYGNVLYPFIDWKTQSGGDASSLSETSARVPAATLFVAPASGNLNVNPTNAEAWYVNGNGVQISGQTADYDGSAVRATTVADGAPDIGADELTPTSTPPALTASPTAPVRGATQTFTLGGRTLARLAWANTGTLPTTVTARYYSGTSPRRPRDGARYLNSYLELTASADGADFAYALTLTYDDALLGTVMPETNLRLSRRDPATGQFVFYDQSTLDATANTLLQTGLREFGEFTGSDLSAPLPVSLVRFEARRQGPDALLTWTTAQEQNNRGFEVQLSTDGRAYRSLSFVASASPNATTARHYQFIDREAGQQGLRYYRLRQVDEDGTATYSAVRTVATGEANLTLYPNPARHQSRRRGGGAGAPRGGYRARGGLVLTTQADEAGTATLTLPAGLYVVRPAAGRALRLVVE